MALLRSEEKRVLEVLEDMGSTGHAAAYCVEHLAERAGLPADNDLRTFVRALRADPSYTVSEPGICDIGAHGVSDLVIRARPPRLATQEGMTDSPENERRRQVTRRKLAEGSLPRSFPRALSVPGNVEATMLIGTGSGQPCSACNETIGTGEMQVSYRYAPDQLVRVHKGCDDMWREELQRPATRP